MAYGICKNCKHKGEELFWYYKGLKKSYKPPEYCCEYTHSFSGWTEQKICSSNNTEGRCGGFQSIGNVL